MRMLGDGPPNNISPMQRVNILGLDYAVTDYVEATDFIIKRAIQKKATSVFALPVHGVVEASRSSVFKAATDVADLIVPDGQPIRWLMNWFHGSNLKDRVYGPKLVEYVLEEANNLELKVFFYGGATEETLEKFTRWVSTNFPKVLVVGAYREREFEKTTLTTEQINECEPAIVFCGLGCPNQEIWISQNVCECEAVLVGVGAAFSFHAGEQRVAPEWMQNSGLEWLFRLLSEPRRLWRRYLFTNSYFLVLLLSQIYKNLKAFIRD